MPRIGLEPTHLTAPEPKSGVSTNFTTWARCNECVQSLFFAEFYRKTNKMRIFKISKSKMNSAALTILQNPNEPDQILWVKRRDLPIWVLPGGGIDPSETFEECALRELREESGITGEILRKAALLKPINCLSAETHIYICSCKDPGQLVKNNEEAVDAAFFPLSHPPYPHFPLHVEWVKECFKKGYFEREITEITLWRVLAFFLKHPLLTLSYLFKRFF